MLDVGNATQTSHVRVVQLPNVASIQCPGFTVTEQGGKYHSPIYSDFSCDAYIMGLPEAVHKAAKTSGRFAYPESYVCINSAVIGNSATKVAASVRGLKGFDAD